MAILQTKGLKQYQGASTQVRFRLRSLLLVVTIISVTLGGWLWLVRWPAFEISEKEIDSTKTYRITARTDSVHYLTVRVTGHINGRATISAHGGAIKSIGPGNVDVEFWGDHYHTYDDVAYTPQGVTQGHLQVKYQFEPVGIGM